MTTVPSGAYTENTIALAPLAPLLPLFDFVHANFFTTEAPEIVKVRSIVPFRTVAPPRVALAAKDNSGSENSLKAFLWYDGKTYESKTFRFTILDRVGGGDAFASGLFYAMMDGMKPDDIVNFAVASSVMKHTMHGDFNITDDVESIKNLMNQDFEIKR